MHKIFASINPKLRSTLMQKEKAKIKKPKTTSRAKKRKKQHMKAERGRTKSIEISSSTLMYIFQINAGNEHTKPMSYTFLPFWASATSEQA